MFGAGSGVHAALQEAAAAAEAKKLPPRAKVARRAGETAAADMHTPAATRADLFGAVDASTFEGLGLATTLSDHLEGDLADGCFGMGSTSVQDTPADTEMSHRC